MTARTKKLIKFLTRIFVTTVLLIWVFNQVDLQQFRQTIKMARWHYLIVVWALAVVIFWFNSVRLRLIFKKQGCDVKTAVIFRSSAITCLYSLIVPGLLSTGVKWYILTKDTGKGGKVLSGMFYNQFSTVIVMTIFGLIALVVTNPASLFLAKTSNQWILPFICVTLFIAVVIFALLLLNSRTGGIIIDIFRFFLKPLPETIRQKGLHTLEQIALFQVAGFRFHLVMALITMANTLIGGSIICALAAKSANISAPFVVLIWLWAVVYILGRLPISIANLGPREAALIGFLALYNVNESQALLMSMILLSASVFMAAIGAIYQLSWTFITAKVRGAGEQV
jgi:uncharacterized membrane protein YbhN (UPF0104 family)